MVGNKDGDLMHDKPDSKRAEMSGLLTELFRPAKDWTTRAAAWSLTEAKEYLAWLRGWFVRTGIVLVITIAISGVGIVFGYDRLVPIALIVAALSLGLLTLLSFPILVIAATFSQLRPVGVVFRSALWVFTWLFGLALLFLVVPMSPAGVLVVMIASLFLSSLYLATGQVPSIGIVRTRAVSVVIVTVLLAFVANALPQVTTNATRVVGTIDATINRWISKAVLTPKAVNIETSAECWNTTFFGPDGEPLYWLESDIRGQQKLFSSAGPSPLTGTPLIAVTRDLRDVYCVSLEDRERHAAMTRDFSRTTSRTVPTQRGQSIEITPQNQAATSTVEERNTLIAREKAAAETLKQAVTSAAEERNAHIAREMAAVETLMRMAPVAAFELRPEWASELTGKTAVVRFSPNTRGAAATAVRRLQMVGMTVVIEPLMVEVSLRRPTIDYSQHDIHAASALNAVLADISQFDMDSHTASVPLSVTLR